MNEKKSNIVDFGAYRKKKGLENTPTAATPGTDTPKTDEPTAEVKMIGKKAPASQDTSSHFLSYMGTGETKNWWVKAGIRLELGIPELVTKIHRATQGKVSPKTLMENIKLVEEYTDEEILEYLKNSDEKKWQQKPTFYRALITVLEKRM